MNTTLNLKNIPKIVGIHGKKCLMNVWEFLIIRGGQFIFQVHQVVVKALLL